MKNIKAIIFDAYGTLFDVNSAAEKCKDKIGDKWEGFANYWRTTQLEYTWLRSCLLYTSPSPRDRQKSRMPSSA